MDPIERVGLSKLRDGDKSCAIRSVVQAIAAVADEPGEDTLAYLMACYQGAKVLAAAGDVEAAINVMNTVPNEVAEDKNNGEIVSLLTLEIGEGFRRLGEAKAAERIIGLGHGIRRGVYGPYHPKVGLSSLMAARTCFDLERYSDAHKFYEGAVVGLGPYHPFNAVAYAERAYAVQLVAPDAPPFPEFVMSAPLAYWRRLVHHVAHNTLSMPLDLRLAVLLNISTEVEDNFGVAGDVTKPLLVSAYQYARDAKDERTEVLKEVLEEREWFGDETEAAILSPNHGASSEAFWNSPDRDIDADMDEQAALFKLFEGAAEASSGREESAREAFGRVAEGRNDKTLEHWAALGSLQLLERGWKLQHQQFKPEMRAIEARARAKLPKPIRIKVQGIEMVPKQGSMDLTFLGKKLTEVQQTKAVKVVQDALAWVTDRSEDAS